MPRLSLSIAPEGDRGQGKEAWQPQPGASLLLARGFSLRRILSGVGSLVETGIGVCWEGSWGAGHSLVGARAGLCVPLLMQLQKPLSF